MKITKLLFLLLSMLGAGCASSSASKTTDSADSIDSTTAQTVDATENSHGVLKALGLKGKVKTITYDEYTFAFDPNGNYAKDPASASGNLVMVAAGTIGDFSLKIDNYRLFGITLTTRFADVNLTMESYNSQNMPVAALLNSAAMTCEEITDKEVKLSYSGKDSHGNYTQIVLTNTQGGKVDTPLDTINFIITYWPDNATAADMPTKLTEKLAEELIKKANRKESGALSTEFKEVLEKEKEIPYVIGADSGYYMFIDGIDDEVTVFTYEDCNVVPEIAVKMGTIEMGDSGDKATVTFHYSPIYDGEYDKSYFDDPNYYWQACYTFENGNWRIDDLGCDINMYHGQEYAENYYKEDAKQRVAYRMDEIKSGNIEKEIKAYMADDPEMNDYLKKVADFKRKHNIK